MHTDLIRSGMKLSLILAEEREPFALQHQDLTKSSWEVLYPVICITLANTIITLMEVNINMVDLI